MVAEARGFIAGASRIVSSLDVVPGNVIPAAVGGASKPTAHKSLWKTLKLTPARAAIAATLLVGVASMLTVRRQGLDSARTLADTTASMVVTAPAVAPAAGQPLPAPRAAPSPAADLSQKAHVGTAAVRTEPQASRPGAGASPKREVAAQSADAIESAKARAPSGAASAVASAAPPPSAPAPATADRRAVREPATPLNEVVVTGATERRDSVAANRANAAGQAFSSVGARATRRIPVAALDSAINPRVPGCYRLRFDPPVELRGFPDPFRLSYDSVTKTTSVRGIDAAGRDSVLNGVTWAMMMTSVLVTANEPPTDRQFLLFAPDSLRATLTQPGGRFTGKVERLSCPRSR